jgi:hypothetical protein
LKGLAAASTAIVLPRDRPGSQPDEPIAAPQVEIRISSVSRHTFRLSILALDKNGIVQAIPFDGSLVQKSCGAPIAVLRGQSERTIAVGNLKLEPKSSDSFDCCLVLAWEDENQPGFGVTARGKQFDRERQSE